VGVNLRGTPPPRLPPARAGLYRSEGLFEFNPARHDFGVKTLLGQRIEPAGFDEVARAVSILAREPATARFISAKLAAYFIADNPPPALVERMAQTFTRTDGDIAAVLRTLFLAPELDRQLAAAVRRAAEGRLLPRDPERGARPQGREDRARRRGAGGEPLA